MKFTLIDQILELEPDRARAIKQVTAAEEYLADHFPGFPVLPGVMMLEAMVETARQLLAERNPSGEDAPGRLVLGSVQALKYGSMVRPGEALEIEVVFRKELEDGAFELKGVGRVRRPSDQANGSPNGGGGETAVSGRFTMRPLRID